MCRRSSLTTEGSEKRLSILPRSTPDSTRSCYPFVTTVIVAPINAAADRESVGVSAAATNSIAATVRAENRGRDRGRISVSL